MFTKTFWKQAAERAAKSAAQGLIGLWVADSAFDLLSVNPARAAGVALGAAALSLLTSIVTAGIGESDSPSAVKTTN